MENESLNLLDFDSSVQAVSKLLEVWRMPASVVQTFKDNLVDEYSLLHLNNCTISELIPLIGPRTVFQVRLEEYKLAKVKCVSLKRTEDQVIRTLKDNDVSEDRAFILTEDGEVVDIIDISVNNNQRQSPRQVPSPQPPRPLTSGSTLPKPPELSEPPSPPESSVRAVPVTPAPKKAKLDENENPAPTAKGTQIKNTSDLKEFLNASPTGKVPLAQYSLHSFLKETDRNKLADCIINNELSEDVSKKLSRERLEFLANCLCEIFPKERKDTFFRVHKYPNGKTIGKGKLYSKYYNTRRCLMQVGLVESPREETDDDPFRISESEVDEEAVNDALQWLENSKFPWDQVINFWDKTWRSRFESLCAADSKPVAEYTDKYPALKDPLGYTLFELDFDKRYKASSLKLFSEWPKLQKFIREKLTEKDPDYFDGVETEFERTCVTLRKFCYLFPVITAFKKSAKNQWRPSKKESEDAFFLVLRSVGDIEPHLSERRNKLKKYGLTLQPQMVTIASSNSSQSASELQSYVVCETLIYEVGTPLKALDVTFKTFFATNAKYPPEAKQMWEFLQLAVYNISTKYDSIPNAVRRLVDEYRSKNY